MLNFKKSLSQTLLVTALISAGLPLVSSAGVRDGGGGDAQTEGRIVEIRDNISKWIGVGRAKALQFPPDVTYGNYVSGMTALLKKGAVIVTAITDAEENMNDEELNTYVDGQPKTCKGFLSKKDHRKHILCNIERFDPMSEANQYRQVHHEYAGLGQFEKNDGAESDYRLSNQLTSKLVVETTLRLPITPDDANTAAISGKEALRVVQTLAEQMLRDGEFSGTDGEVTAGFVATRHFSNTQHAGINDVRQLIVEKMEVQLPGYGISKKEVSLIQMGSMSNSGYASAAASYLKPPSSDNDLSAEKMAKEESDFQMLTLDIERYLVSAGESYSLFFGSIEDGTDSDKQFVAILNWDQNGGTDLVIISTWSFD